MRIPSVVPALFLAMTLLVPAYSAPAALPNAETPAQAEASRSGSGNDSSRSEAARSELFDFSDKDRSAAEEQQYLVLDESIKLRVDPLERSAVVDRVNQRATIYVRAPGSVRVEVYLEPVDSPFCGKALGQPKLLGQSSDARRNFPVNWSQAEQYRYVKVYALAYRADGVTFSRSRSLDLSMSGPRFNPPPLQAPQNASR